MSKKKCLFRNKAIVCGLLLSFVFGATLILSGCNVKPPHEMLPPNAEENQIVIINMISPPVPQQSPLMPSPLPPSLAPSLASMPTPTEKLPLAGYIIGIDPGHQAEANTTLERLTPKSRSSKKEKVSSGTKGRWSNVPEFEVTLAVGLLLRDILIQNGATVVMTRTTNDVDISNMERAFVVNDAKTDYALRIHCNGAKDETKKGASILIPRENPFQEDCRLAADLLLSEYCETTGIEKRGIDERGDQTCFNWCDRLIINIEMGYMSNPEEDAILSNPKNYESLARGLAKGIMLYFEQKENGGLGTPPPMINP